MREGWRAARYAAVTPAVLHSLNTRSTPSTSCSTPAAAYQQRCTLWSSWHGASCSVSLFRHAGSEMLWTSAKCQTLFFMPGKHQRWGWSWWFQSQPIRSKWMWLALAWNSQIAQLFLMWDLFKKKKIDVNIWQHPFDHISAVYHNHQWSVLCSFSFKMPASTGLNLKCFLIASLATCQH